MKVYHKDIGEFEVKPLGDDQLNFKSNDSVEFSICPQCGEGNAIDPTTYEEGTIFCCWNCESEIKPGGGRSERQ
jgi:hypothetical protein